MSPNKYTRNTGGRKSQFDNFILIFNSDKKYQMMQKLGDANLRF